MTANKGQFWDPDCRVGWWGSLGLEVSYNENYCLEGRAERRTGATEGEDGVGEARSIDCVYRHIPLHHALRVLSRGRSPSRPPCLRASPSHGQPGQLWRRGWASPVSRRDLSSKLTWGAHRRRLDFSAKGQNATKCSFSIPSYMEAVLNSIGFALGVCELP